MMKENQEPSDNITLTTTLFVYGTLRKGLGNHYFLDRSKFLGMAKTKKRYALYGNGIPFLSRKKAVSQVTGEVYAVDADTLRRLDQLEGHPDWYRREQAEVVLQNANEIGAWIYFCDTAEGNLIESGDFLQRTQCGGRKRNV
jgi:gamma-glutamylcyclotransferase (GGCT)/AIG2-like uncharacterized protein YtfP